VRAQLNRCVPIACFRGLQQLPINSASSSQQTDADYLLASCWERLPTYLLTYPPTARPGQVVLWRGQSMHAIQKQAISPRNIGS
jgi:hypothetical protein